ncbi:MAG: SUMF1/EgtB/PvdO family nonheme iron enzyme [Planctomycetes bacterium]|nr:SUMF1/EgtB/PvdO family nonheme iron enzyme [Planctomycetota bacterium]
MPDVEGDKGGSPSFFHRKGAEARPQPAPGLAVGKVVGDFRLVALLGQGGMGQVWEAEQVALQRRVAVKFVRPERVTAHQLELFAREARAGGRLSHPGIVSVYGHGTSDDLAWIAMELVGGAWTLKDFLDEATRASELPAGYDRHVARFVAEIAEALAAAHAANVIHRDVKPQNVLITADDHPKVTDFGLARITDEAALSVTGDFAGTYLYMSPEQAMAKRMGLDHRTDVFSLGVVLYELLALRRPFEGDTSAQVAEQIVTKDPPDPRMLRSKIPRDLAVIALHALEKERTKRYATMQEFAADLGRYLAGEPIQATPPTRLDRAVKWVKRNPGKSSAAAIVAVTFTVIALLLVANVRTNRALTNERANLANANTELAATAQREKAAAELAKENEQRADREADAATKKAGEVLRLSALQDLEDLLSNADKLWPAYPENISAYESWIEEARKRVAELPQHRSKRAELRSKALPQSAEERRAERESHPDYLRWVALEGELTKASEAAVAATSDESIRAADEKLVALEEERNRLDARLDERRDWRFPESEREARWWNNQLTKLIAGLEELELGLLAEAAVSAEHGWSVPKRLSFARSMASGFGAGGAYERAWSSVLAAMRSAYPGLELTPELGLLPIGRDPESGLWEFAHLQTGEPAERGADGRLVLEEGTGIVFVLLPGGTFQMGVQKSDPNGPNYDAQAESDEGPVHAVTLTPFFLSKYELTQGQWQRFVGGNPSRYGPHDYETSWNRSGRKMDLLHPVELVSWTTCMEVLARLGLDLPTESQWEYGSRGGTTSAWWTGSAKESLVGAGNVADTFGKKNGGPASWVYEEWLDDGNTVHARVGSYTANAFGLHDVVGNVWEWCRDVYGGYENPVRAGDGEREVEGSSRRVYRGGSFAHAASDARSANRYYDTPEYAVSLLGLRLARTSRLAPTTSPPSDR